MANIAQEEVLVRQVATLMLAGLTQKEVARQLNVSLYAVQKAVQHPSYETVVREGAERELGPALAKARTRLAKLVDKAVNRIEKVLDSGQDGDALKASQMVLKAVGVDQAEQQKQEGTLIIHLPGSEPQAIDVESEVKNEV